MKITTNLASPPGRMMPYLAGVFLLLSVVSLAAAAGFFISARHTSSEMPELEQRLEHYRSREIKRPISLVSHDKLVELREHVRKLNEITSTSGPTLPMLLTHLETLIPDGVSLSMLEYQAHDGEVKLVAETKYPEQLTTFMERLERSTIYSQVLLTRQTQRAENDNVIQFEIQLRGKS